MPGAPVTGQFVRTYDGIRKSAREYKIADVQAVADFVVDWNSDAGVAELRKVIDTDRPETILCMETLEHANDHFEVMKVMAYAVENDGSAAFITLPHHGNWIPAATCGTGGSCGALLFFSR